MVRVLTLSLSFVPIVNNACCSIIDLSESFDLAPADSPFDFEEWFRQNPFDPDGDTDPSSSEMPDPLLTNPDSMLSTHQPSGSQGK